MPKRTDTVEHDLGLLDGILDGSRVEDIECEYLDRIVDGQTDGEKLGARPRGQPDGEFGAFWVFEDVACRMTTAESSCADEENIDHRS